MGRVINIANKLDREPRFLILDDTHKYKVDCSKNAVLKIMSLEEGKDAEQMDMIIKILLGNAAFKEIDEMGLPFDNMMIIMKAALAVAMNKNYDDVEADFRDDKETK